MTTRASVLKVRSEGFEFRVSGAGGGLPKGLGPPTGVLSLE